MIDQSRLRVFGPDGSEVHVGDEVTSFRGERATYYGITRFGRTGTPKASVAWADSVGTMEYNATVFDLDVIEVTE